MRTSKHVFAVLVALLSLTVLSPAQQKITEKDIQDMVREMDAFVPRNPNYQYPARAVYERDRVVNATAGLDGKKPVVTVHQGLVDLLRHDRDMVRAVIAHELGHHSAGHHLKSRGSTGDRIITTTRQWEYEADRIAAIALEEAGHSKNDMVRVLLYIAEYMDQVDPKNAPLHLTTTHPESRQRAAAISNDPQIFRSAISYRSAMAMMQAREYAIAETLFARAYQQDRRWTDAFVMQGQAALMAYYDALPDPVKETLFKPDFGPILPLPSTARGTTVTAEDQVRYRYAMDVLRRAQAAAPQSVKANELLALGLALEPLGAASELNRGLLLMNQLRTSMRTNQDRLRLANNTALVVARISGAARGSEVIRNAMISLRIGSPEAVKNLLRSPVPNLSRSDSILLSRLIQTFFDPTSLSQTRFEEAARNYENHQRAANLPIRQLEMKANLSRVMSLTVGTNRINLLQTSEEVARILGTSSGRHIFDRDYPDLFESRFQGGDVRVIFESNQAFRITSYAKGSSLQIRTDDPTSPFRLVVTVGSTVAEFERNSGVSLNRLPVIELVKAGGVENWYFIQGSQIGIYSQSGRTIDGITILPSFTIQR